MSLKVIIFTYMVGGITLPPLFIIAVLYFVYVTAPKVIEDIDDEKDDDLSDFDSKEYHSLSMTQLEDQSTSGTKAYKAGWMTVTREYHNFVPTEKEKGTEQKDNKAKSAYTALYRLVKNNMSDGKDGSTKDEPSQPSSPTTSSTPTATKSVRKKNRFFAVLRHGNLFLYKNEDQKDVQNVIVLSNHIITIWPRHLRDGELFTKKTAVCLLKRQPRKKTDTPPLNSAASLDERETIDSTYDMLEKGSIPAGNMGFFIYCDTNFEKENWYFELIKATKRDNVEPTGTELDQLNPSIYANALHFKTADMISLIQTLHSSEGQIQTRWLNAAIGRIFLALQSTEFFEHIVETKLLKKLAKINRPGFLEEFQVKKIDVGNAAPSISFPKLQELNPDGSLRVSFKFTYTGKLSLQVATKANIKLGSAFKTREVGLLLAVTLNKLEGPMVICVKKPPSSRLWWTFEKMPEMDLTIEPVVSQRQITYSMVTKVIENKFRNAIKESLVEPFWDDISFFDTSDEFYRGGIWDTKLRPQQDVHTVDDDKDLMDTDFDEEALDQEAELAENGLFLSVDTDSLTNDAASHSETNSLRSRGSQIKSKGSFNSLNSIGKKKTDAYIRTSDEQYLADGSFVAREITTHDTASDTDMSVNTSRSSTMQLFSDETAAGKKALSTGLKKISKWYGEKSNKSQSKNDKSYNPPEMISKRRALSSASDNQQRDISNLNADVNDHHKTAPQPHAFPAEYMYGMDTQAPDNDRHLKVMPPTKIPDMMSPYSPSESRFSPLQAQSPSSLYSEFSIPTPTSPRRSNLPRRKPVSEDVTIEELGPATTVTEPDTAPLIDTQSTPVPPELPARAPTPALPPRELISESPPTLLQVPSRGGFTGGDADISNSAFNSSETSLELAGPILPEHEASGLSLPYETFDQEDIVEKVTAKSMSSTPVNDEK